MRIASSAFAEGALIPKQYSKSGASKIPLLTFEDVPKTAGSLVLIVDDPDAPKGTFNHWLVYNLDPKTNHIGENGVPSPGFQGKNDYGESNYGGPGPPSGEHRYFFKLYALDSMLSLPPGANRQQLDDAMEDHVVEKALLMGRFQHNGEAK